MEAGGGGVDADGEEVVVKRGGIKGEREGERRGSREGERKEGKKKRNNESVL